MYIAVDNKNIVVYSSCCKIWKGHVALIDVLNWCKIFVIFLHGRTFYTWQTRCYYCKMGGRPILWCTRLSHHHFGTYRYCATKFDSNSYLSYRTSAFNQGNISVRQNFEILCSTKIGSGQVAAISLYGIELGLITNIRVNQLKTVLVSQCSTIPYRQLPHTLLHLKLLQKSLLDIYEVQRAAYLVKWNKYLRSGRPSSQVAAVSTWWWLSRVHHTPI